MGPRHWLGLWKHPIIRLIFAFEFLVPLPLVWSIVAPNFVQTEIEEFILTSHHERYGVTLSQATIKHVYGLLMASPFFTALLAAPALRYLCDHYGRRMPLLVLTGLLNVLCGILTLSAGLFRFYELLFLSRLVFGPVWCCCMIVMPLYVAEIAPAEIRGAACALVSALATVLLLVVNLFGLPQFLGTPALWYFYLSVPAISGLASVLLCRFLPESPKFLLLNNDSPKPALSVMRTYYQGYTESRLLKVVAQFQSERNTACRGTSLKEMWGSQILRRILIIATLLGIARIACGSLLIRVYSTSVASEQLGLESSLAKYIMVSSNVISVVASFVAIAAIEVCGRRTLYFFTSTAMFICCLLFFSISVVNFYAPEVLVPTAFYIAFVALLLLPVFFHGGFETVTAYYIAELTPHHARASAATVKCFSGFLTRLVILFAFPSLQNRTGPWSVFSLILLPFLLINIYLYMNMPETAGKQVNEIMENWLIKLRGRDVQIRLPDDVQNASSQKMLEKSENIM